MSVQQQRLTEIAEAIRYAEGSGELIPALSFAARIRALSGGGGGGSYPLQGKTATPAKARQIILPDSAYYGLSSVTVEAIPAQYQDVSGVTAGAADVLAGRVLVDASGNAITGTMADNGGVSVTLAAGGSYTIPAGYHDGSGVVTAAGGGTAAPVIQPLTVTENGSYTPPAGVDGYSPVYVSVATEGSGGQAEITAAAGDSSLGSVSGGGAFAVGETATLTASPAEGVSFAGWYENGELVSGDNPFLYTIPSPDRVFTAKFSRMPEEYTQLSALYHGASGQLSLGVGFTANTRVDVDITVVSSTTTDYTGNIWGRYLSTAAYKRYFSLYSPYYQTIYINSGGTENTFTVSDLQNRRTVLSFDNLNGALSDDGTVVASGLAGFMEDFSPIYLTPAANAATYINASFHRVSVYESGTLANDFVPVRDAEGNIGFYDLIQGNFIQAATAVWSAVE